MSDQVLVAIVSALGSALVAWITAHENRKKSEIKEKETSEIERLKKKIHVSKRSWKGVGRMNDAVLTLLLTVITAVIAYVGNVIAKNDKARTVFNVLEPLARDAVIASQKLGVTEYLSGAVKKNHAVQSVIKALSDAGFSIKDKQAIENAIEKAYAEQKELLAQYPQKEKE